MADSIVNPKRIIKNSPRTLGSAGWRLSDTDSGQASKPHAKRRLVVELTVMEALMTSNIDDDILEMEAWLACQTRTRSRKRK